jgi:hypothetical protein
VVHATNSIDQPTTLHHHGMFFNSTSWMDGALGVTQWYVYFCSIDTQVIRDALLIFAAPQFTLLASPF